MEFQIKILNRAGIVLAESSGEDGCSLIYEEAYLSGDQIVIDTTEDNIFVRLRIDDGMDEGIVYMKEKHFVYEIPFREKRESYPVKAFTGNMHVVSIQLAEDYEVKAYRNLSFNSADQHQNMGMYPHAHANVETRGESVFAARNAIDGYVLNGSHGVWPYESWGINMQDDAWLTVDFGREVNTDCVVLYTRADFPHDNWWKQVTLVFSDGSELVWNMEKSSKRHVLRFQQKTITWIRMERLIKSEEASPFPALSQIEVYGIDQ